MMNDNPGKKEATFKFVLTDYEFLVISSLMNYKRFYLYSSPNL